MSRRICECAELGGSTRDVLHEAVIVAFDGGARLARCDPSQPMALSPTTARPRRRLWELPPCHHCVLLGAAFDARELRQMFRRVGYVDWESASDYALHSSAVHFAKDRNDFSRLAHKLLEERYSGAVARFKSATTPRDLLALWRGRAAQGDPVSAYWAALTHPACDTEADEALSQEMHVLAHDAFAARRCATRRIAAQDERILRLETALDRSNKQRGALKDEAARLREETCASQRAARVARAAFQTLEKALDGGFGGEEERALRERIDALSAACEKARTAAIDAQRELKAARRRIAWLESRVGVPQQPAESAPRAAQPAAVVVAPAPDLASMQVLCVGGKTGLVPRYRALVERARGAFLHHDGGQEDQLGSLPALLGAADAVVCLSGDVSHGAYLLVKNYCKRRGKPCALLANSSVSALSRCLYEVPRLPAGVHPIRLYGAPRDSVVPAVSLSPGG